VRASFSLTYLGNIVKTLKRVAEKTTLEYATNKPLRFEAENEKLKIEFMVAPRID
jgi:DNA polymerase III sliding clamp (beta) subunit (PCNA family)